MHAIDVRIFLPALALVALTFVVWLRLFFSRLGQMKREHIHPQAVALSSQAVQKLTDSRAADNFRNLFELPVLFYLALLVAALTGLVDTISLSLAWAFVGFRVLHSAIHCSYNRVRHRFAAYLLGGLCLWVLWIHLALGLVNAGAAA